MPSFTVNQSVEVEVNFEVYCDTCGAGLCYQSKGVATRTRGEPSVRVEACRQCIDKAVELMKDEKDDEIEELKSRIRDLEGGYHD